MSSSLLDVNPKEARARKCAQIYFMMMRTEGVAPRLSKAMIQAGYSPRTASQNGKLMASNKAFLDELKQLELQHFDYAKALEITRNKAVKSLMATDYEAIKVRKDVAQIANTTNEMLRLERGQSTQNVAIADVLNEIEGE